jgi:hypothetical protein
MKVVPLAVLAAVVAGLVLAGGASAGGFATVQLSSLPTGTQAGTPWSVDLAVLQHGVTPLDGIEPAITVYGGESEATFPATPTGAPGVYHAEVVFPAAGTWSWRVWDGFTQTHTYAPVEIAPAGGAGGGSDGVQIWLAGLAGAAALAFGGAMMALTARRRSRPSPA